MKRRDFLKSAGVASAAFAIPGQSLFGKTSSGQWRTFEVTTRVEVARVNGPVTVWVPAALITSTPYQKILWNRFDAPSGVARLSDNQQEDMGIVTAKFAAGTPAVFTLTSRIATRDVAVDFSLPAVPRTVDRAELRHFLRPTKLLPTDGIVKEKANEITKGATTDVDKARAIYEWIVDCTFRDAKTPGCGLGDIRFMLESGNLGGKCADLNSLFVGLARAAGLPARDVFGIRVAKSGLGYRSLGTSSETITKAQHCRAEVYLAEYGWVPVDPADVRKVMLEEPPGNRPPEDDMVKKARARLFGSWEMNWMAYNFAHDVSLPGSHEGPVSFFMYPQAETAEGRLDCLDAANFKYEISSREISSAIG